MDAEWWHALVVCVLSCRHCVLLCPFIFVSESHTYCFYDSQCLFLEEDRGVEQQDRGQQVQGPYLLPVAFFSDKTSVSVG